MWKQICYPIQYLSGIVVAYLLIVPVWICCLCGRVRTRWSPEARLAWRKGGVLFIANHPSLIQTIVLPSIFWYLEWLGRAKHVPWSLADEKLFGNRPWLYQAFRCIVVSRDENKLVRDTVNKRSVELTLARLSHGGVVLLYPEGGRTFKGSVNCTTAEGRQLRQCKPKLVQRAVQAGSTVIPIWFDHGVSIKPESFWQGYVKLFFGPKCHIYFGTPLKKEASEITEEVVADAILQAGK